MAGIPPKSSLHEIFAWIYNEVASFVDDVTEAPSSYQMCINQIIFLLNKYYSGKEVHLLIEEIPFEGDIFSSFVSAFSSLVVSGKLKSEIANIHFVISSIENPLPHLPSSLEKIRSIIKFLEFGDWSDEECFGLITLIKTHISIPTIENTYALIHLCENLPRSIKLVFRDSYQTSYSRALDSNKIKLILERR